MNTRTSGAIFSPCQRFRYVLWRDLYPGCTPEMLPQDVWGDCVFCALNPSTATETIDDPTIRRCKAFAKAWNCRRYVMLNAFSFRSTDPKGMLSQDDPIGPENDRYIREYTEHARVIVAAWGTHADRLRAQAVCEVIGKRIECLGVNADGSPKHPLYLPKVSERVLFWEPGKTLERISNAEA
jgi:hypothetical protein